MKTYETVHVLIYVFFTSAIFGAECSASCRSNFIPRERTHDTDCRAGLDPEPTLTACRVENLSLIGIRIPTPRQGPSGDSRRRKDNRVKLVQGGM
jgi:hypothetical protein